MRGFEIPKNIPDESRLGHENPNAHTAEGQEKERQRVLEYARRELPQSEPRIADRMRPNCRVSVAIPAYQEGLQILGPLAYLTRQEGVSKDEYEAIVNINNRKNPDARTKELNNLTLKIVACIKDASADTAFLSDSERSLVEEIRNSGLIVHGIDKSTEGSEIKPLTKLDFKEVGPMQPRKRTMDEISERFALSGKSDGIIASLDADTKVNPKWIRQIIDSFADNNTQLLAGERRDGLDLDEAGTVIDRNRVMNTMLDYWNSDERQKDGVLGEFPNIETQSQRAEILLMSHLIDAYNFAREKDERGEKITGDVIENFRGGSGKAFRVGAYIRHPREIIEMMDTTIDELPEGLRKDTCRYVGRSKDAFADTTTQDAAVEALAIYPETRIRSWQLTSPDSESPYRDFKNLHNPFGSSGKEFAYAVVAVLTKQIPTTEYWRGAIRHSISIIDELQFYGGKNQLGQVANPDRYFFDVLSRAKSQSNDSERQMIEAKITQIFGSDTIPPEMSERVSYAEAAEKYKRLLDFS